MATVSSVVPLPVAPKAFTSIQGAGPLICRLAGAVELPTLPVPVPLWVKIEATEPAGVPQRGVPLAEMAVAYCPVGHEPPVTVALAVDAAVVPHEKL